MVPLKGVSQDEEQAENEIQEYEQELEEYGEELREYGEQQKEGTVGVPAPPMPPMPPMFRSRDQEVPQTSPRFGLYLDDIDFEDAYEMHYPENYGVRVDGVVRGGNADRAGLRKGDIIMEFDGEKVRYEDHLLGMRNSKHVGDTVEIKFFRDENVLTTKLTFYPPEDLPEEVAAELGRKKRLSPGYGGGGFEPIYVDFNFVGVNQFLINNGFKGVGNGYIIALGGGGAGNVGNGWFIGGMGAGFDQKQQIPVKDSSGVLIGQKRYEFRTGFGGVTITKKIPLFTKRLVLDVGTMLGGGSTILEMSQTDGDFSWTDVIGESNSYSLRYEKAYFAYRPSVGLLVRIKNWFGIHGSVGYLGTFSTKKEWTQKPFDFTVGGVSPETLNGLSYSLGVWFGY